MLYSFEEKTPRLGENVFIAPDAAVLGDVVCADNVSIWYGCVVRGDVGHISIGRGTNIQDQSVIHITGGHYDTAIGAEVTVGHRAILHGCTIGDRVLIGMGAIVMDDVHIGENSLIGAGALVTPGTKVPPGSLVLGSPAKVKRMLSDQEKERIDWNWQHYVELAQRHQEKTKIIS
ncbi:MAG: gamma carbonic anhydrase family protein [Myxococcales bacterium]|nr:gamma carbonic anhydrase family protein [Myxococcales bacterium]|tara:strand:- start:100 stop:624 length:525 start_codon:yes stop_codon:yes gene_type:complete